MLTEKGRIELSPGKPSIYRATPKGEEALAAMKQVEEFFLNSQYRWPSWDFPSCGTHARMAAWHSTSAGSDLLAAFP